MVSKEMTKILYAEDEEDIRAIAEIALEDIGGFTVEYANNGKHILELAEAFKPDLLLFDVMMPVLDGPGALRELRKKPGFAETPVIFMTAKVQPSELQEYLAMGALDVIRKPFDPMTLANDIRKAWDNCDGR